MQNTFYNILKSIEKNKFGILLMILNCFLMAASQLLFKNSWYHGAIYALIGVLLQIFSTGLVMFAYRFGSFSVLSPVMSLSMVLAVAGGKIFFHEGVSLLQMAGLAFVVTGVGLISAGDI